MVLTGLAAQYPLIPQNLVAQVLSLVALLFLIFVLMKMAPSPLKYVVFGVFLILLGNTLAPLTQRLEDKEVLQNVLAMVAGVFLGMTALAVAVPGRFLGLGPYLLAGLVGLILARLGLWIGGLAGAPLDDLKKGSTVLSYLGVGLFALYIAYDTQVLKTRMGARLAKKDPIAATLDLYLDIVNLFASIGDIMGE